MRKKEGFLSSEVNQALIDAGDIIINKLVEQDELKKYKGIIRDTIGLSIQIMIDEIEDTFESN
jgi:hypothetical protein